MPRHPQRVIFPDTLDWSQSDIDIAKLVGCQRWYVNYMRRKLNKPKPQKTSK